MSAPEPASEVRSGTRPAADAFFALSRDLLCTLTRDGTFLKVSESCARLTGFAGESLAGEPLLSFVHPLDRALAERAFLHVLRQGYADDVPTRFRTLAGGHVSLRWSAVYDPGSECVYAVAREMKYERERTARRRARAAMKAATAERERLRADLHDGLLQSLAGASLKLTGAVRLLEYDLPAARELLESVAALLQQEQRELRFLVEEMKDGWLERRGEPGPPLNQRLAEFTRRLHATWEIELLSFSTGAGSLPDSLVRPLFGIIHEAVVNAVRHGKATAASVQVELGADAIRLRISDNGHWAGLAGRLDDADLRLRGQGPAVLKHRVWSLGGTLVIEAHAQGVVVTIRIPLQDDRP